MKELDFRKKYASYASLSPFVWRQRALHAMIDSLLCKLSSEIEGMKYSLVNAYNTTRYWVRSENS
jgi:hypothetical protein